MSNHSAQRYYQASPIPYNAEGHDHTSSSYCYPDNYGGHLMGPSSRQYSSSNDSGYSPSSSAISPVNSCSGKSSIITYEQDSWDQTTDNSSLLSRNDCAPDPQTNSPYPSSITAYGPNENQRPAGTSEQFICLYPKCDSGFSRLHDLKRHIKTHCDDTPRIDCKEGWCGRVGKPEPGTQKGGFSRRDHYVEHLRKVHMKDIPKGRGSGKGLWV